MLTSREGRVFLQKQSKAKRSKFWENVHFKGSCFVGFTNYDDGEIRFVRVNMEGRWEKVGEAYMLRIVTVYMILGCIQGL